MNNLPTTTEELNDWRKLITGTIKDTCTNLNITVNEFVKTPVGMGVAGLIIYKIAGKELLLKGIDILLIIPTWIIITTLVLIVSRYMLGYKTVYDEKIVEENGKPITRRNKKRVPKYIWYSQEAKMCFGSIMLVFEVVLTIIALVIIFN